MTHPLDLHHTLTLPQLGAALANPVRSALLCVLMEGRAYTVKELASHVGAPVSSASEHLTHLAGAGLVAGVKSGRCRYYRIANPAVADLLEAAGAIAKPSVGPHAPDHLRAARSCYNHLAGRLGVELAQALLSDGRIEQENEHWHFSAKGQIWVRGLGLTPAALKPCLDWTERMPHMGGPFATNMLRYLLNSGILRRHGSGRGLELHDEVRWRALCDNHDPGLWAS